MATHMACLGCPVGTEQEYVDLAMSAAADAMRFECADGFYLRWADGAGAELWVQGAGDELFGMNPHFAGRGRMRVSLTTAVARADDSPLDGARHVWVDPTEAGDGLFPLVFDLPNARLAPERGLCTVQIAAFAEQIACWPNEDSFHAAPAELALAAEAFIPLGLWTDGEPGSTGLFTGRVLEVRRLRNALGGGDYFALLVKTLGGTVDVVTPCEGIDPDVGCIVKVEAWLSARVVTGLGAQV
ncbi:MAG: hypothetical protein EP330_03995 [Deltaproteobacteria bacterium]|nr:MAG: hypothetical protein EP330_03995 [Deltaproteobacteria bacterium]